VKETSKVRKIAFVGDYLPRKCGIATLTSGLLAAVATAHPQSLEKKRAEVMARDEAGYFIREWQELRDQVRQMIRQDARFRAIEVRKWRGTDLELSGD
jgi:hypothetical protein